MMALAGMASAAPGGEHDHRGHHDGERDGQVGLVNLNNTDVLHNVDAALGVCENNINVLGVQVPLRNVANGLNVPLLSRGDNEAENDHPYNCASADLEDGGSSQHSG
ncbi:hypothetical protein [Allokutzneria albata]|nr:hypothetical protein [Allokutzneria albata]